MSEGDLLQEILDERVARRPQTRESLMSVVLLEVDVHGAVRSVDQRNVVPPPTPKGEVQRRTRDPRLGLVRPRPHGSE